MERYEDALADAQRAILLDEGWAKGYYRVGLCSLKLEKYRQAKEAAVRGLEMELNNSQLKDILAQADAELAKLPADYSDARVGPLLRSFASRNQAAPSALTGSLLCHHRHVQARGNAAYKEGQYEEAVRLYTAALELCPIGEAGDRAALLTNRAESYRQLTHMEKVVEDCTAALELASSNTKVRSAP
eukprot:scaffold418_cov386-Prasinococcus_capsulatus_cf.AAC.23